MWNEDVRKDLECEKLQDYVFVLFAIISIVKNVLFYVYTLQTIHLFHHDDGWKDWIILTVLRVWTQWRDRFVARMLYSRQQTTTLIWFILILIEHKVYNKFLGSKIEQVMAGY